MNPGTREPIAIVGMACCVPGAGDYEALWALLAAPPRGGRPERRLESAELFDAARYGISEQEAQVMDPQCRRFLMLVDAAFADAGYPRGAHPGTVGVVASQAANGTYHDHLAALVAQGRMAPPPALLETVNRGADFLATRVSYVFDLQGPSFNLQSGCSSSLVAAAEACHLLWAGRCDAVVAGGMTITYPLDGAYAYEPGSIYSRLGVCRPFDAEADGTVPADGGGAVVLKTLSRARRDGDRIHALVRGVGVNNDGAHKVSFAAPAVDGQVALLKGTYADAGVAPDRLAFVECHATATAIGDPIEVRALRRFVESYPPPATPEPILLGSIKGHIGHLFWSSGIVSMIKSVLALKHRVYPGTAGLVNPNPLLALVDSPFSISADANVLDLRERTCCGVSSFGVGGTNAHVILEQAPDDVCRAFDAALPELSARRYTLVPDAGGANAAAGASERPEAPPARGAGEARTASCDEIVELYTAVLAEPSVTPDSDYFELNGDSISAVELIAHVSERYGVMLAQTDIYDCPTPALLTARINARVGARAGSNGPDAPPRTRLNAYQARFYLLEKLQRGDFSHYNVPLCLSAGVAPDWPAFCAALDAILSGLPDFSMTLKWTGDGIVLGERRERVTTAEAVTLAESDDPERCLTAFFGRRFDLERGPAARVLYVRHGERHHVAINFPHLLIDGTGLENLLRRVERTLKGERTAEPVPVSDTPNWRPEDATYWREQLAGTPASTLASTPGRAPREAGAPLPYPAAERCAILPDNLLRAVRAVCRVRKITPFVLFYAVFNTLVARRTGMRRVLTGTTLNNRDAHTLGQIDCRITNLPIGVEIDETRGYDAILAAVRERLAESMQHANAPLDVIVQASGRAGAPYRMLFMFQNQNTGYRIEMNGHVWEEGPYRYRPLYTELCLQFQADADERIRLVAHYDPGIYSETDISRLTGEFIALAYEFTSQV
ncbi:hypothetical protein FPJ27_13090 [Burkholderia sp. MS455]|uniref:polyketide synthase n=1 Tax=Burkholderia sp. MS455 TaxID=2811788 RepID=UPI00195F2062|nr:polyketide synthase [Burkholderia sp. MS455]QRR07266.1 hypothetical protein FPJ27_13090 [Burkholderia sp. MS455]